MDNVDQYFEPDGAPIRCPKCGSTKTTEKVISVVDVYQGMGPTCEAECYCECGECVGYWAYGSWDPHFRMDFTERNPTELERDFSRELAQEKKRIPSFLVILGTLTAVHAATVLNCCRI